MFGFVGSFCFILVSYFSVVCCTACRMTSRGGYTTATRWGRRRQRSDCRPGVFFCSSFDFCGVFASLLLLCLPMYFLFFVCFILFPNFIFISLSFIFLSLSAYRGGRRMYVVLVIAPAQWDVMALLLILLSTTYLPVL